jgi:phosphoribosylformylglycinamidine synthase
MQTRIFIERQNKYQIEVISLIHEIKQVLGIHIPSLRYFVIYDIQGMTDNELEQTMYTVFAEKNKDIVHHHIPLNTPYIAYEYLPGQYDQRADSALQCVQLSINHPGIEIKTGTLILFEEGFHQDDLKRIEDYLINWVESRPKNMSVMEWPKGNNPAGVQTINGFIHMSENELNHLHQQNGLAMTLDDLSFIQQYFQKEDRDPYETELKVLDTYWSDHCRHTTFETMITEVNFKDQTHSILEQAFLDYLDTRQQLKRDHLPMTLMDMATINARYEMKQGHLNDVEISDEHNAASIVIDVDIDGSTEPWLLMFKNETHNHPTEIEPFGGASTCIGGAIRDPLSGRSYVYSATRITGASDITEPIEKTLKGKLPQRVISKKAAEGYSSYGNQIGLATTFVQEIYHEGYKAKRMEVGAVIGAAPQAHVRRYTPKHGDLILLIGGRTGRDGMGGATGSSKSHQISSIETSAAEVQKGNAVTERKIQRLFRNPEFAKCIKKSNDFGAGGVSVAIGELASGIKIQLDLIPTKYQGLSATELAISESQERMAVVIDPRYETIVKDLCYQENLEVTTIAHVTDESRLIMTYRGEIVCDLDRNFIDSSGVRMKQDIILTKDDWHDFTSVKYQGNNVLEKIKSLLEDPNIASQQGLVEMFDSTIGTTTVLMPYGGKTQKTKAQASIQRLPIQKGNTQTVSIMTFGFDPYLMEKNPYLGASYAIIDSIAKTVASGGNYQEIRFTFQEYFERLGKNASLWGKPFKALLGAYTTLKAWGLAAIGGKDSMSGSFESYHVPPTFISFAVSKGKIDDMISNALVKENSYLYLVKGEYDEHYRPKIELLKKLYESIYQKIKHKIILSAYALSFGGLIEALIKSTFGNRIGISVSTDLDVFKKDYGSILIESQIPIQEDHMIYLGRTTEEEIIDINKVTLTIDQAMTWNEARYQEIYPLYHHDERTHDIRIPLFNEIHEENAIHKREVHVLLPIFPGTNCEYDSERAFNRAGANVTSFVFNNLTQEDIQTSIHLLAHHLDQTDILMISGGFSSGDEPDGSGKFIANVLRHPLIAQAIRRLRLREGLILGICNGFQALIKSGLLPYGEIAEINEDDPNLHKNLLLRHVSKMVKTKVISTKSPWLKDMADEIHHMPISHGEGRLVMSDDTIETLIRHGQIAFQYVDDQGIPSYDPKINPNGSSYAIEGIISKDGLILGKMGHSERLDQELYKNIPYVKEQSIFRNAVTYIKQRGQKS